MNPKKTSVIKLLLVILTILFTPMSTTMALVTTHPIARINSSVDEEYYTLFSPEHSTTTYLLNYDKEVVHTWESEYTPGHASYLLENGHLLHAVFIGVHPVFLSGGMGGGVQEIDWNGSIVWDFQYSNDTHLSHHDITRLPNGNVLLIAWETKTYAEAIAAGRNPSDVTMLGMWPDHVIEVKPTGPTSGDIVWEWHVWDHLVQDYDASKENYGVIANHPELIDINYGATTADWLHTNSIDYNEDLDQILLSVHNFNEIWVIDHSTTTEEAAGHIGGNSGKGGDLLYRWGNPRVYRAGTADDQQLFGQHDATWITSECPGAGDILVFNNGLYRPGIKYSSVDEIVPPLEENGNYYLDIGSAYGPEEPIWSYTAENPIDFYSYMISGAQRMPNGNTIICDGKKGIFFEVTPGKQTVWQYTNPFPSIALNAVFKIESYTSDYSGLANIIEQPRNPDQPIGETQGKKGTEYVYTSITTDPQNDQIYYLFNWGDNSETGWIGPYDSGEIVNASHAWTYRGNYNIKVKAKDSYGHESDWSDPLPVSMPTDSAFNDVVVRFIQQHPLVNRFIQVLLQWRAVNR
jgi:hypothetical protein